jgi:pimeloyl-ACP methyl ester carboxylesterase
MKNPLLLLHGALGSKKQFEPLLPLLQKHFTTHTLNFQGHGGSPSNQAYSIELFTQNVLDYLASQNLESISIFGYSMGGYVALNLALQHPSKVSKIVTLGTKFNWTPEAAAQEVEMLNPEKIEAKVPAFANKLAEEHQPLNWKEVMLHTAEMMLSLGKQPLLTQKEFEAINQPVTIGIGSQDQMVSLQESQQAADELPNGRLEILDNTPHPIDKIPANVLADYIEGSFSG